MYNLASEFAQNFIMIWLLFTFFKNFDCLGFESDNLDQRR